MTYIPFVNPRNGNILEAHADRLIDKKSGEHFPIVGGIPRFCTPENYSQSFGFQWNLFDRVQLDSFSNVNLSEVRFYAETAWEPDKLSGLAVLEIGSGAGRFTELFLRTTRAHLYSLDYSLAVEANWKNNLHFRDRLHLVQASIYEIPFPDKSFDKLFCLGVLQHTPSFSKSISAIVRKVRIDGEIVVDFYPINGWYTKIHSKYLLRPITKRLPRSILVWLIRKNIRWMLALFDFLCKFQMGFLTRFIPVTDVRGFPKTLSFEQRIEWAVMDTFDAFSPEFDYPQRISDVIKMFEDSGCEIAFAGKVSYEFGVSSVVRAVRKK